MESNEELKKPLNRKIIGITAAIAAAVCIALVAVIFAMGGSAEKRLAEQLDLAKRYLAELDYEQVVAAFKAAIEINPKCEEAYLGLADAYVGLGDYESAIEAIEEGIEQTGAETLEVRLEEIYAERAEQEAIQAAEGGETEAGQEDTQDTEDGESETETSSPSGIGEVTAGQIITFGSYEQDGNTANGKEPIEWYVLEASGGEAVLLSVYLLDCQPYHEEWEDATWENCTLRRWMNSEFYNTAFSAEEQQAIVNTNVVNEDNPYYGTEGGSNTADKVWLLSLGEVEKYFHIDRNVWNEVDNGNMSWEEYAVYCYGQDHRVCAKPTAYAVAEGLYVYSKEDAQADLGNTGIDTSYAVGSGWWWLCSPGSYGGNAVYVLHVGAVDSGGIYVDYDYGVRPALKVAY